jgi:hypothetical protein
LRASLFSPQGPPRVVLDGRIPVHGVRPSRSVVSAYEVETLLAEPTGTLHRLDAVDPTGAKASIDVHPEPFLRGALRPRALLVGNSDYVSVRKLPGVKADLSAMTGALRAADGWALDEGHLVSKPNLSAADLVPTVETFFQNAVEGETLFFYFAGHGHAEGREGYLLPVDYSPGANITAAGALSSTALWKAALGSKAARIVIVLDACRAGEFHLPETLGDELDNSERLGLVLAASAGSDSYETPQGGRFTQPFVAAMRDSSNIDYDSGAVTLARAYLRAAGAAPEQRPRLKGGQDAIPIAWPKPARQANAGVARVTGTTQGSKNRIRFEYADSRQATAEGKENRDTLDVMVTFGEPADTITIGVYDTAETPPVAHPELITPLAPQRGWQQGQEQHFKVPLKDLARGNYRVEVQPCLGAACDSSKFEIELKRDGR